MLLLLFVNAFRSVSHQCFLLFCRWVAGPPTKEMKMFFVRRVTTCNCKFTIFFSNTLLWKQCWPWIINAKLQFGGYVHKRRSKLSIYNSVLLHDEQQQFWILLLRGLSRSRDLRDHYNPEKTKFVGNIEKENKKIILKA